MILTTECLCDFLLFTLIFFLKAAHLSAFNYRWYCQQWCFYLCRRKKFCHFFFCRLFLNFIQKHPSILHCLIVRGKCIFFRNCRKLTKNLLRNYWNWRKKDRRRERWWRCSAFSLCCKLLFRLFYFVLSNRRLIVVVRECLHVKLKLK